MNKLGKSRLDLTCSMEHLVESVEAGLQHLVSHSTSFWDDPDLGSYIDGVLTYAQAQTEAFLTVYKSGNYIGASSFPRLLADCCVRVYVLRLWDDEGRKDYLRRYFEGKEVGKKKYKGKEIQSQWRDLLEADYPIVNEILGASNKSVHFSRFHYHDYLNTETNNDGSYAERFSEEGQRKLLNDMYNLLMCLTNIIIESACVDGVNPTWCAPLKKEARLLGTSNFGWGLCGWVRLDKVLAYLSEAYLEKATKNVKQVDYKRRKMGKGSLADVNFKTAEMDGWNFLKERYDFFFKIKIFLEQEEGESIENYETFLCLDMGQSFGELPILDIAPWSWDGDDDDRICEGRLRKIK